MNIRILASVLACGFLLLLVQLIAALAQPVVGVFCGAVITFLFWLLLKFFQVELPQPWARMLLPSGASLLAVAIAYFAKTGQQTYLWFAPALAFATAGVFVVCARFGSRRCALCGCRLRLRVAFACPRCALTVCDDTCWVFESCRCRLCEQNRVPIFVFDGRWWDRELGPRTKDGRCQLCQRPAQETDLRPCRRCGRPFCRDCWDALNGQCSRCQWTIADLPESLRAYIASPTIQSRVVVPSG
jgi:hypothetical protein